MIKNRKKSKKNQCKKHKLIFFILYLVHVGFLSSFRRQWQLVYHLTLQDTSGLPLSTNAVYKAVAFTFQRSNQETTKQWTKSFLTGLPALFHSSIHQLNSMRNGFTCSSRMPTTLTIHAVFTATVTVSLKMF